MALTKTAIKALVASATRVIQKEYPKATGFCFDGNGNSELEFRYFNKDHKESYNDGMIDEELGLPVEDLQTEFPECCGYSVMTDFTANPTSLERATFTLAFHGSDWKPRVAAFFATTANQPGADAMLLANGFELIHTGRNPGSGNLLRAYIYKVTTPRSRRKS